MTEVRELPTEILTPSRFQEVSINQVQQMVAPEGACECLDYLTVNQGSFKDVVGFYFERDQEKMKKMQPFINQGEIKSSELKPLLDDVLHNRELLHVISGLPEDGVLKKEELRQHLNTVNDPLVERAFFVLNYSIDPELIPYALAHLDLKRHDAPELFINQMSRNEYLRRRMAGLITNPTFRKQYIGVHPNDEKSYSKQMIGEINGFINDCSLDVSKNPQVTKDQIVSLREYLQKFFNLRRDSWGMGPSGEFFQYLRDATKHAYFESFQRDKLTGEKTRYALASGNTPIRNYLSTYEQALGIGEYTLILYQTVKDIYKKAFPEIYQESDVKLLRLTDPRPEDVFGIDLKTLVDGSNGYFRGEDKSIGIQSGTVVMKRGVKAFDEETVSFFKKRAKRKVADTVTMAHEFTHSIYEKMVRGHASQMPEAAEKYHDTADHAVNEGFAVMMELLFIDTLKANPALLDLSAQDVVDLETWKQDRLFELKKEKSGYTEGTYRIMHKVYSEGAGKGGRRDMHAGLVAIRQFLGSLDPNKTLKTSRSGQEYKDLLKKGDPQEWTRFFSQPQKLAA